MRSETQKTGFLASQLISYISLLKAHVGPSIVACYQDLAKQVTVALKHEERRCQYLSTQAKIMTSVHDDIASLPEGKVSVEMIMIIPMRKSIFWISDQVRHQPACSVKEEG